MLVRVAVDWGLAAALALLLGCRGGTTATTAPPVAADTREGSGGATSSAASASATDSATKPELRFCAIAPLALVGLSRSTSESDSSPFRHPLIALDASGTITGGETMLEPQPPRFDLKEPGCGYENGRLVVERLPDGRVWTIDEGGAGSTWRWAGSSLVREKGQLRFEPDGRVIPSKPAPIEVALEGFRPGLECAGAFLVLLYLGTKPAADGPPSVAHPTSRCSASI